jgi:hypothetical protein
MAATIKVSLWHTGEISSVALRNPALAVDFVTRGPDCGGHANPCWLLIMARGAWVCPSKKGWTAASAGS